MRTSCTICTRHTVKSHEPTLTGSLFLVAFSASQPTHVWLCAHHWWEMVPLWLFLALVITSEPNKHNTHASSCSVSGGIVDKSYTRSSYVRSKPLLQTFTLYFWNVCKIHWSRRSQYCLIVRVYYSSMTVLSSICRGWPGTDMSPSLFLTLAILGEKNYLSGTFGIRKKQGWFDSVDSMVCPSCKGLNWW